MKRRNFLCYSLLSLAGCTTATSNSNSQSSTSANWPKKLRFAVSDAKGLEELQQNYEALRKTLEEVLETTIDFFPVDNYFVAAPALLSGELDIVLSGSSEYLVLNARGKAVPLVALTRPKYYTLFIVKANSKIDSLADLKGKTIEMARIGSTGGYVGGIKLLLDAGLDPKSDVKIVSSNKHSLQALKSGEVDAWSRPLHRYQQALNNEGASFGDYPAIAKGKPLPNDIFVVSSLLAPKLVEEIRARLLDNRDRIVQAILSAESLSKKFQGATLVPANDADYDMIREVYKALGQEELIQ